MRKFALLLVWMCTAMVFAQNKNQEVEMVSHTVQLGETVRMLSKKYLVDPSEIYRLNKFAVNGISQGMVLQIPVPKKEPVVQEEVVEQALEQTSDQPNTSQVTEAAPEPVRGDTQHTVQAGETLYSLSRQYSVPVADIKAANAEALKKGLKIGQVVTIPNAQGGSTASPDESGIGQIGAPDQTSQQQANSAQATKMTKPIEAVTKERSVETQTPQSTEPGTITHTVAPKETLYALSKMYGVTVDEIKAQNPDVAQKGLQVGQMITIRKN